MDDTHHLFTFQADVQVTSEKDIRQYTKYMKEMKGYVASYKDKMDVFGIDCGDMVGDSPHLFPSYLKAAAKSGLPIFRSIGNHDMTYGGRTYEYCTASSRSCSVPATTPSTRDGHTTLY